jgi:FkbM family methyltransferase
VPDARDRVLHVLSRAPAIHDAVMRARRSQLRIARRRAERAGDFSASRPAAYGVEDLWATTFGGAPGFFVEAGANDGFAESNTYWLERARGWSGLLVEPVAHLAEACRRERPGSTVVQAALVGRDLDGTTVPMREAGLVGHLTVDGGRVPEWREAMVESTAVPVREVEVPARSLSSLLDEVGAPEVDLLALDVEGFEVQALSGLDWERHAPRYLFVEVHDLGEGKREVDEVVGAGERYEDLGAVTPRDVLYRRLEGDWQ